MTNLEFVEKLKDIANNYKTLYVLGCFGAPMTTANKDRYIKAQSYNAKASRKAMINAASADTFGFDCVCLIKAVLWGWSGDKSKNYGGALYASNCVPDIGTEVILGMCTGVSTSFSNVEVGELLWMQGHVGIYIGDGFCVECTPSWKNGVQITPVLNMGTKNGTNGHRWTKHGKLPYITYESAKKVVLESGNDIVWELMNNPKYKIEITEVQRAIKAIDKAKTSSEFMSLYWILHKLVNGNQR